MHPAVVAIFASGAHPIAFCIDHVDVMTSQLLRDHLTPDTGLAVHRRDRRAHGCAVQHGRFGRIHSCFGCHVLRDGFGRRDLLIALRLTGTTPRDTAEVTDQTDERAAVGARISLRRAFFVAAGGAAHRVAFVKLGHYREDTMCHREERSDEES